MSFVEGLSTSIDIADPAFALCLSAAVVLVTLLLAAPALATALRFLRLDRGLGRVLWHLFSAHHRGRDR